MGFVTSSLRVWSEFTQPVCWGWGGRDPTTVAFQGRESRALRESSRMLKLFTLALQPYPSEQGQLAQVHWCRRQAEEHVFPWQSRLPTSFVFRLYHLVSSSEFSPFCFPQTMDDKNTHEESAGIHGRPGRTLPEVGKVVQRACSGPLPQRAKCIQEEGK